MSTKVSSNYWTGTNCVKKKSKQKQTLSSSECFHVFSRMWLLHNFQSPTQVLSCMESSLINLSPKCSLLYLNLLFSNCCSYHLFWFKLKAIEGITLSYTCLCPLYTKLRTWFVVRWVWIWWWVLNLSLFICKLRIIITTLKVCCKDYIAWACKK